MSSSEYNVIPLRATLDANIIYLYIFIFYLIRHSPLIRDGDNLLQWQSVWYIYHHRSRSQFSICADFEKKNFVAAIAIHLPCIQLYATFISNCATVSCCGWNAHQLLPNSKRNAEREREKEWAIATVTIKANHSKWCILYLYNTSCSYLYYLLLSTTITGHEPQAAHCTLVMHILIWTLVDFAPFGIGVMSIVDWISFVRRATWLFCMYFHWTIHTDSQYRAKRFSDWYYWAYPRDLSLEWWNFWLILQFHSFSISN